MKNIIWGLVFISVYFSLLFVSGCKDEVYPIIPGNDSTGNHTANDISNIRGYKDCYIGTFRCGLFIPHSYQDNRAYPLIIYLHGYSDTTSWNLEWYKEPILSTDPVIVMTPKCPITEFDGWGDSWTPSVSPMMESAFLMYNKVDEKYNIDHDRIYIYGTSMGGFGTYAAIQQHPFMFAAAYVECGNGNTDMAGILANIPLWIFHGSNDPVVSVQGSRDMYKAILEAGGTQVRYTEYPGVLHNTWDYVKNETTLTSWLLLQRKESVHARPGSVPELKAESTADHLLKLSWNVISGDANEDNNYWFCRIYRDNTLLAEIYNDRSEFTDTTVVVNTSYNYKIAAVNYFFKESEASGPETITLVP